MPVGDDTNQQGVLRDFGSTSSASGRTMCKIFTARLALRLLLLLLLVLLAQFVDVRGAIDDYCAWVATIETESLREAVALYALGGTFFCTVSPTGYLPSLLAGALFPWWVAWPLSYAITNLGALCNLLLVRGPCHPLAQKIVENSARMQSSSGFGGFGWLDSELTRLGPRAYTVVALVRLPYLWSGFFNYVFALSAVRGRAYLIGNLLGLLPGSLIFSLLGSQAQSLLSAIMSSTGSGQQGSHTAGRTTRGQIVLLCAELAFLVAAMAALGLYFRRVWQQKAEAEAARGPNPEYRERVALLAQDGAVMEATGGAGLGYLGIAAGQSTNEDEGGRNVGSTTGRAGAGGGFSGSGRRDWGGGGVRVDEGVLSMAEAAGVSLCEMQPSSMVEAAGGKVDETYFSSRGRHGGGGGDGCGRNGESRMHTMYSSGHNSDDFEDNDEDERQEGHYSGLAPYSTSTGRQTLDEVLQAYSSGSDAEMTSDGDHGGR